MNVMKKSAQNQPERPNSVVRKTNPCRARLSDKRRTPRCKRIVSDLLPHSQVYVNAGCPNRQIRAKGPMAAWRLDESAPSGRRGPIQLLAGFRVGSLDDAARPAAAAGTTGTTR